MEETNFSPTGNGGQSKTDVRFKELTKNHYKKIVKLWENAGLPYKPRGRDSKEQISRQMDNHSVYFLGAFIQNSLVGIIIGTDDGRKGWLNRLAVKPEYREKGIGGALVKNCESWLRKRGRKILCVQVEDWNEQSMNFFINSSYKLHNDIAYLTKRDSEFI